MNFLALSSALNNLKLLHDINVHTITLMGFSFLLGSIFTILVLLILDWTRAMQQQQREDQE